MSAVFVPVTAAPHPVQALLEREENAAYSERPLPLGLPQASSHCGRLSTAPDLLRSLILPLVGFDEGAWQNSLVSRLRDNPPLHAASTPGKVR